MAPRWIVLPHALKRLRVAKAASLEGLAEHSGISARMLRTYESKEQAIRSSNLKALAQSLGVKPDAIARLVDDAAPTDAPPAPAPARAAAPARTALETLVDLERRAARPLPPLATARGLAPHLTVKTVQDVFTAYRLHDGTRHALVGRVDTQRGIPADEAKLLGSAAGVAARFHVFKSVADGQTLGVTVHTRDAAHTRALQAAHGDEVTLVVFVHAVSPEDAEAGRGFSSFITAITDKRPWTFVVEEVVEGAGGG